MSSRDNLIAAGFKPDKDGLFSVVDRHGTPLRVTADRAIELIRRGGGAPSLSSRAAVTRKKELERQVGTPEGKLQAVGLGAAETILPGISTVLPDIVKEDVSKHAEVNRGYFGAGQAIGLGVGLLSGTGAASMTKALGGGIGGAIIRGGTEIAQVGKSAAGILGTNVLASAVEGGLFSAAQEVTHASITDKPLTGEALASSFLKGSVFGAGAGVIPGALGYLGKTKEIAKVRKAASLFDDSTDAGKVLRTNLDDHLASLHKEADRIPRSWGKKDAFKEGTFQMVTKDLDDAKAGMKSVFGKAEISTDDFVKVMQKGDIGEVIKGVTAYTKYANAVEESVRAFPGAAKMGPEAIGIGSLAGEISEGLLKGQADSVITALSRRVEEVTGVPGALDNVKSPVSLLELAGVAAEFTDLDEALLGPVGSKILSGAILLNFGTKMASKSGKGILTQAFQTFMGRATEGGVRRTAGRLGVHPDVGLGLGAVGNLSARKAAGKLLDSDISEVIRAQVKSQGRVARAVRWGGRNLRSRAIPLTAIDIFKGVMTEDEASKVKAAKGSGKRFLEQMKIVRQLQGNQDELLKRVHDITARVSALDPELGDLTKRDMLKRFQFLAEKFPQNPGNMQSLSGDRWLPSLQEMAKWMRYAEAATDPAGAVEKAMAGRMTPEAAEALKILNPAHFRALQMELVQNPEKVQEMPFKQRINLGSLFDVPTDPTLLIGPQLAENFRVLDEQAQAVQAGAAPNPPSTGLNQPTAAQGLSVPRTNQ